MPKLQIELHNTMPRYRAHEICREKDYEIKKHIFQKKNSRQKLNMQMQKAPSKKRQNAIR